MLCMSQNNKATGTNLLWSFGFDGGTYTTREVRKMNNYLTPLLEELSPQGRFHCAMLLCGDCHDDIPQ